MATHKYGSFVGRKLLSILCGRDVTSGPTKKQPLADINQPDGNKDAKKSAVGGLAAKVDPSTAADHGQSADCPFPELLERVANEVLSDTWADEMSTLQVDTFAGPFLQALLRACKGNPQLQGKLVLEMLGTTDSGLQSLSPDVPYNLMTSRQGSHLMEAIFEVAPDDIFQKLSTLAFKGRLVALAQHPSANFAVQAALASIRKPQQLKRMIEDLRPHIGSLLKSRRGGVVVSLLAAAGRLQEHEGEVSSAVWHAAQVGLGGQSNISPLEAMLTLDTTVVLDGKSGGTGNGRLSSLGCAALVTIFRYPTDACKQWAEALAAMPSQQLALVGKDPGGCRVIESYLEVNILQKLLFFIDSHVYASNQMCYHASFCYRDPELLLRRFGAFSSTSMAVGPTWQPLWLVADLSKSVI